MSNLDNRYKDIKCANYSLKTKKKRSGNFSLVFKGIDTLDNNKPVAIKLYDPDAPNDPYRLRAFQREPEILNLLIGKNRCLQLVDGLQNASHVIKDATTGLSFSVGFQYFVTEWLDEEIIQYFLNQHLINPVEKLLLFNDVVLSVEALHRQEVFHRDLKSDNFRGKIEKSKRVIIAIDIGTSIHCNSRSLIPEYIGPVGYNIYAAPETWCGLAGNRSISKYTDFYALGCFLFELFNFDKVYKILHGNRDYKVALSAMSLALNRLSNDEERLPEWRRKAKQIRYLVAPPSLEKDGISTAPLGIQKEIDYIIQNLTRFDFNERKCDFEWLRNRIWRVISVLKNEKLMKKRMHQKEIYRKNLFWFSVNWNFHSSC